MYDIKEVLQRMKTIAKVDSNIELAQIFQVSYNTLNTWLKRKKFPQELLIEFCKRYSCSLDYLLFNSSNNTQSQEEHSIFWYYGAYEPLHILSKAKLLLEKHRFVNGGFYLIEKENIYFIAQVFFSFENHRRVTLLINNDFFQISLDTFKQLSLGLIIDTQ